MRTTVCDRLHRRGVADSSRRFYVVRDAFSVDSCPVLILCADLAIDRPFQVQVGGEDLAESALLI